MKQILTILAVLLWAGGIVSGLVLTIAAKALVPAVSIVVLGILAFPTVKRLISDASK